MLRPHWGRGGALYCPLIPPRETSGDFTRKIRCVKQGEGGVTASLGMPFPRCVIIVAPASTYNRTDRHWAVVMVVHRVLPESPGGHNLQWCSGVRQWQAGNKTENNAADSSSSKRRRWLTTGEISQPCKQKNAETNYEPRGEYH